MNVLPFIFLSGWSLSQCFQAKAGSPWTSQFMARLTYISKHQQSLHTYGQFRVTNYHSHVVFWTVKGSQSTQREPMQTQEDMQAPHRHTLIWELSPTPSCFEATVLTIASLCCLWEGIILFQKSVQFIIFPSSWTKSKNISFTADVYKC